MNKYNDIEIHPPLSSSTEEQRYLLSCGGQYYEASRPIVDLVEELQRHATEDAAIAAYVERRGGKYTPEQVRQIIDKFVAPLFAPKAPKRSFLYEKELFSAAAIDWFSDRFRFLFHPACMLVVLGMALGMDLWFFLTTHDLLLFNNKVDIYMVVGLLAFMLGSSFFHELGHASACKYFGVQHGGVGFGLYLNFPVLYTDVTEVWRLGRAQRCVVNLAGVYFQSYWLIILLMVFFLTGNDIVRYLVLIMNLGFVMTLNPFFKFDGYWLASDILGVPNLRARSKEVIAYFIRKWRGKPSGAKPYLLQVKRASRYGLLVYSVVVNVFMAYYFCYILPKFLVSFVQSFPEEVSQLVMYLSNGMTPSFALLRNIGMQLVLLALVGMMVYKLVYKLRIKS